MSYLEHMETIRQIFDGQKRYFASRHTLDIKFRKEQLRRLAFAIDHREKDILKVLESDLGKCAFEGWVHELMLIKTDIKLMLKNLNSWSAPERVPDTLGNFPSTNYTFASPYGVTLIMAPWNYPIQLALMPLVSALAAGNTAIISPSEHAPATSKLMHEIIDEHFKSEYVAVIEGGVPEKQVLLELPFDYIFFTGSTEVGKVVMQAASEHLTPVTLELGGKSPAVIDETAKIKTAARRIVWGKFMNAGQTCVAPDYLLVHESREEELLEALTREIVRQYGDDPKVSSDYGRIIHEGHFDRLAKFTEDGILYYGGVLDRSELFIGPTVLREINWGHLVMQEEIFGPVLPVLTYSDWDEALRDVEKLSRPLAFYLFSENAKRHRQVVREMAFGDAAINDVITHMANHRLPFGGIGSSGMGAYHGKFGFDTFSHLKGITKKPTWIDLPLRYAPYGRKLNWIKKLLG